MGRVFRKKEMKWEKSLKKKTGRRPKRGAVPQAATGLSEAREEAERLASCGRRVGLWIWAKRKIVSLQTTGIQIIIDFVRTRRIRHS